MKDITLTSNTTSNFDFQGTATVSAYGTFNGATISANVSFDGGATYVPLTDGSDANLAFTAAGAKNIQVGKCKLQIGAADMDNSNVTVSVVNLNEVG